MVMKKYGAVLALVIATMNVHGIQNITIIIQTMNIIIIDMEIIRLNIKYLSSDKYFIALGGIG